MRATTTRRASGATPSRRWTESYYDDLRFFETLDRGGHFAAFEQPELFVQEVRAAFRAFR